MGEPTFFQIPGNIKQRFLPFVLNPNAKLHRIVSSSPELKDLNATPQIFSYRRIGADGRDSGTAQLNFCPSSLTQAMVVKDDISFKLLYGRDAKGQPAQTSITATDILNAIPGVQIREFLPDTRLDQCINVFIDLIGGMKKLFAGEKDTTDGSQKKTKEQEQQEESSLFQKIKAAVSYTMKYMVCMTNPNFMDDLTSSGMSSTAEFDLYSKRPKGFKYVVSFPYTLYRRLQSCVTTNIYEVPAAQTNKTILTTAGSGSAGWTGGSDLMTSGGLSISKLFGHIPVVGQLTNMLLGNVGINYMPWWNASSGTETKEPAIELKFDLFNDSYEAAMANFIFVNTIVPNNKWIQYNMFQHSSNLYDIKIEGINRLFACSGEFTVTYDGVLRDPPNIWVSNLVNLHANKWLNKDLFMQSIVNDKLIKIPDVYHVNMTFQSILPANFNTYLYNYVQNTSHITKYSQTTYEPAPAAAALPKTIAKYARRVSEVWEKGDENAGGTVDTGDIDRW